MAKNIYPVVDGITRKQTKAYAAIDGYTRKIAKMYAVIDGVTRLIWSLSNGYHTNAIARITYDIRKEENYDDEGELYYDYYYTNYVTTSPLNNYLISGDDIERIKIEGDSYGKAEIVTISQNQEYILVSLSLNGNDFFRIYKYNGSSYDLYSLINLSSNNSKVVNEYGESLKQTLGYYTIEAFESAQFTSNGEYLFILADVEPTKASNGHVSQQITPIFVFKNNGTTFEYSSKYNIYDCSQTLSSLFSSDANYLAVSGHDADAGTYWLNIWYLNDSNVYTKLINYYVIDGSDNYYYRDKVLATKDFSHILMPSVYEGSSSHTLSCGDIYTIKEGNTGITKRFSLKLDSHCRFSDFAKSFDEENLYISEASATSSSSYCVNKVHCYSVSGDSYTFLGIFSGEESRETTTESGTNYSQTINTYHYPQYFIGEEVDTDTALYKKIDYKSIYTSTQYNGAPSSSSSSRTETEITYGVSNLTKDSNGLITAIPHTSDASCHNTKFVLGGD